MTDEGRRDTPPPAAPDPSPTAGTILRQARQAQGLHIVALAASIKVTPRKLEALEADRYEELLDATFARALAKAVCRALKIDAEPVLARLPQAGAHGLDRVASHPNTPFREPAARSDMPVGEWLRKPAVWGPLALVVAAAVVWLIPGNLLPTSLWGARTGDDDAVPAAASPEATPASGVVVEAITVPPLQEAASAPGTAGAAAAAPATGTVAGALVLRTSAGSWVEVIDAKGQTLISRLVAPGESVGLDGTAPLRVTIGNATATQITYRGKPVALPAAGRDNVVRLELK